MISYMIKYFRKLRNGYMTKREHDQLWYMLGLKLLHSKNEKEIYRIEEENRKFKVEYQAKVDKYEAQFETWIKNKRVE